MRRAGVRHSSHSAYTASTTPPSRMGSAAPDNPISPIEAPSIATHGAAERPSGRCASRSRAAKAHGSQAPASTMSMCTLWAAMKPP